MMDWFTLHYAPAREQQTDWRLSLFDAGAERYRRLPRVCAVLAAEDPLLDEGAAFVAALRGAGVAVECREFDMKHGFMGARCGAAEGQASLQLAAAFLRRTLLAAPA